MKTVILAAGFGSRVWPLSTPDKPKQFQPLLGDQTVLQTTYDLFARIVDKSELYVLTLKGLEHLVTEQLPGMSEANIIVVPERRNTLPHIAYAVCSIAGSPEEPVLFTTVDYFILDQDAFVSSVREAMGRNAHIEHVTLLYNHSDRYDGNAGYFKVGEDGHVSNFLEKPSKVDIAKGKGAYHKDTSLYIFTQAAFRDALQTVPGDIAKQAQALLTALPTERDARFLDMPFVDISSGLLQKATNLVGDAVEGDFVDLGTFAPLYEMRHKDEDHNAVSGNVILENTNHSLVINQTAKPLVVINMQDAVIVQGEEGTVVAPMNQANAIGEIYKTRIHPDAGH